MEFGTGGGESNARHDENDYAVGKAHGLESIVIFDEKGVLMIMRWALLGEIG